ncbi:MAG TPA: hypothetical protein VHA73_11165 [Acidimicrobiales bacterium]|nr:hypothetical protein [Acidimicrobiales bacterium]
MVVIGNGTAGAWALAANWLPWLRTKVLWWYTIAAELAIFVQVGLGVGLISAQHRHAPQFHLFYGFVALVGVAIIYSYRAQVWRYRYLLYGLGGLFLMGLGIRAMFLATPGTR